MARKRSLVLNPARENLESYKLPSEKRVQEIRKVLRENFPTCRIKMDIPDDLVNGIWHIDFWPGGGKRRHTIGIKLGLPIGYANPISLKRMVFGEGWPEVMETPDDLVSRILFLFKSRPRSM